MRERWRVAVLDSGLGTGLARLDRVTEGGLTVAPRPAIAPDSARDPQPLASCRFVDDGRTVLRSAVEPDHFGHGTSVAQVICDRANRCDLLIGQVLDHRGVTTAAALAAAIDWSVREGVDLIHMSLGLREDRQILAKAVAAAVGAGCIIVASTPARGEGTYPARYPSVIRATGDARCRRDEISDLHSARADFGGCPRYASAAANLASPNFGGASLGAAHVTHFLVEHVAPGPDIFCVRAHLSAMARYAGVETRGARVARPDR